MQLFTRKTWYVISGIVALLVVAHAALPFVLRRYALQTLNKIPGYRAKIDRVYVNLFRGAYQLKQVKLEKMSGAVPVPFFDAPTVDLSVQWAELFHGAMVGAIVIDQPRLNFVNSPAPETSQTTMDKNWVERVKELFPLKI